MGNILKYKLWSTAVVCVAVICIMTGCGSSSETDNSLENAGEDNTVLAESEESVEEAQGKGMFESIDTVDFQGNAVTVETFENHKLTLINAWATWCGPCLSEIPELEELYKEYGDEGEVGIKGLVIETNAQTGGIQPGLTDKEQKTVEEIMQETGAAYQQILVSEDMIKEISQIYGFPTTYFVDANGKYVGEPVIGARSKEDWKLVIEERLGMIESE